MAPSLRILTVDPHGTIARVVRAALDLIGRQAVIVDMPSGREALEEIRHRSYQLLITNVQLGDDIKGYQLALETRQASPTTQVVILAEINDPELDAADIAGSPFVYLHRPVDIHQFLRVLVAGLDGASIFDALHAPAGISSGDRLSEMGAVPPIDTEAARSVISALVRDVPAMAIVLTSRMGDILIEHGAVGYLDRERLAGALLPMVMTTVDIGELVGGHASTLHFYDGEQYDVFVLSVGIHHFLCLVFEGAAGNRHFGAVNRFGRRAAEDLVTMLGDAAYRIQKPAAKPVPPPAPASHPLKGKKAKTTETAAAPPAVEHLPPPAAEPEPLKLEPIADLDISIFDQLGKLDLDAANDLFDPEKLAELAAESRSGNNGPIDFDNAMKLGIVPDL